MRKGMPALLGAATVLAGTVVALTVAPTAARANVPVSPPASAIVTGVAGPYCPSPSFSTIQDAIDAAAPGATIYVCSGTYDESPTIDEPLTLVGAQWNVDARSRAGSAETVVDGAGGITYTTGATSGTINGFTLQGSAGTAPEITAAGEGAGWQWLDNIIDVSNGGISFNTGGEANPAPTSIWENLFTQSVPSAATTGDAGRAVMVAGSAAANVTVESDAFENLSGPGAAIDSTGTGACGPALDSTNFSDNLRIALNAFAEDGGTFTDPVNGPGAIDEPFVNLVCTDGAHVRANTLSITDAGDANAKGPIDIAGGDWSTDVDENRLAGDGATNAPGIVLDSDAYRRALASRSPPTTCRGSPTASRSAPVTRASATPTRAASPSARTR